MTFFCGSEAKRLKCYLHVNLLEPKTSRFEQWIKLSSIEYRYLDEVKQSFQTISGGYLQRVNNYVKRRLQQTIKKYQRWVLIGLGLLDVVVIFGLLLPVFICIVVFSWIVCSIWNISSALSQSAVYRRQRNFSGFQLTIAINVSFLVHRWRFRSVRCIFCCLLLTNLNTRNRGIASCVWGFIVDFGAWTFYWVGFFNSIFCLFVTYAFK